MSIYQKTIDDITRTKVLLDKTERIPGRDNDGDFKITFQNLQDSLTTTVEIGTILMYAKATAPANYLTCDGSAISRATYSSLFAVIGTVYGVGDGSTTFNLPNYQAVVPKGVGNQTINTRSKSGPAFATTEEDREQGHRHSPLSPQTTFWGNGGTNFMSATTNALLEIASTTGDPVTDGTNGTPRTGATTRENSIGTNFIIRYA